MRLRGYLLALVAWAVCAVPAHGDGVLSLGADRSHWNLMRNIEILRETSGQLTAGEVAVMPPESFHALRRTSVNLGVVDAAYWCRFTVRNESESARVFYVEVDNPLIQRLDFYAPLPNGGYELQQGGTAVATPTGLTRHDWPVFQTRLEAGTTQQCLLRVENHGPFIFKLRMWDPRAFMDYRGRGLILLGLLYGVLAAMAAHSLLVYVVLRERTYLYSAATVVSLLLYELSLQGTAYQYIWPFSAWWADRSTLVFICVALFTGMGFVRAFLNTRVSAPRLDKLLLFSMGLSVAGVVANLSNSLWTTYLTNIFAAYVMCLLSATCALIAFHDYRPARFMLLAWGLVLVCGAVFGLVAAGIIPRSLTTEYSFHAGIGLAPIVFAMALAARLREMRQSYQADLETQVAERTAQLRDAVDNVKTLKGLIPICSHCKKVRDDKGYWSHIEAYIQKHSEADLSHSLCPTCVEHLYGKDLHARLAHH